MKTWGVKEMKFIFLAFLIFFLNGCNLAKNNQVENVYPLKSGNKMMTFDSCANFSYISRIDNNEKEKMFVEYINLNRECNWNGLQRGYFEYLFKSTLKLKDVEIVERIDYKNYEFTTYIIDKKYYLNLIYIYNVYEDYFIVDYTGNYAYDLMKKFSINYKNDFIDKQRFYSNYSNSLVKMNFINSYFSREREGRLREF